MKGKLLFLILFFAVIPFQLARAQYKTMSQDIEGRINDVYTQYPSPYGGQGLNATSESFGPQQWGVLYANVTYDTDLLPDKNINTCNVWVSGIYEYSGVPSSLAQVNFLINRDTSFDDFYGIIDDKFTGETLDVVQTLGIPVDPPRGDIGDGTALHFRVYDANLNAGSGVRGFVFTRVS